MLNALDSYFLKHGEPIKSCLLFLRSRILKHDVNIKEVWSYNMPFYFYSGKRFCYLWVHKKSKQPYIGFVDGNKMKHSDLLLEKRSRMKIFLIDPENDIPVKAVDALIKEAIDHVNNAL